MSNRALILAIAGIALLILAGCSSAAASNATPANSVAPAPISQLPSLPPATTTADATSIPSTPVPTPKEEGPTLYKIADVVKDSKALMGKSIIVEGKIVSECGAGCWFTLNDGSGTIYVDLAPSNLSIPQKRGAKARVFGNVTSEKGETYLIGTKVEF